MSLHYLLTLAHKDYGSATFLSSLTEKFTHLSSSSVLKDDHYYAHYHASSEKLPSLLSGVNVTDDSRANATFVILARNSDLEGTIRAIKSIEDRFNRNYGYPYVFLNDEPFSINFIRFVQFPSDILSSYYIVWQSNFESQPS